MVFGSELTKRTPAGYCLTLRIQNATGCFHRGDCSGGLVRDAVAKHFALPPKNRRDLQSLPTAHLFGVAKEAV